MKKWSRLVVPLVLTVIILGLLILMARPGQALVGPMTLTSPLHVYLPLVQCADCVGSDWSPDGTVEIIDSAGDGRRIYALIANRGVTATLVRVDATTPNGNGAGFPYVTVLHAGEQTCVRIVPWPRDWTTYTLSIGAVVTNAMASRAQPAVVTQFLAADGTSISGAVQNTLNTSVTEARAVGTLFDADGRIVNCSYAVVDPSALGSQGVGTYDIPLLSNIITPTRALIQTSAWAGGY